MLKKLNEITKVSELFEVLDWDLDGNGMIITDGAELAWAIVDRFPELEYDMQFAEPEEDY